MSLAISRGCPQGGVLSLLLWCLVVDDLLARLSGNGVFIQRYTDDIRLLAMGKFPNTLSGLMKWALLTVETRCNDIRLSVNPDKTGFIAFTRKRKLLGFFEPQFFGVKLSLSGSVKYLGVILDSRLTWKEHVDVKMRKAHNLLWACRRACAARWGLKPKVVHWLYIATVQPSASSVWWPGCQTASATKRLSKVQRCMLRYNGSDLYHSYWCYGDTHWPPSAGSSETGRGEVSSTSSLEFGVLGLTFTPIKDIVTYRRNFRSLSSYLIWESTL